MSIVNAQSIQGHIQDAATGKPIDGASIVFKSKQGGATSDADGNFNINAKIGDILLITALGYAMQEKKINEANFVISLIAQVTDLDQVVVLGSRKGGRVKTESPVPVDVISMNNANQTTAKPDLTSLLNYAAPSFNFNKQSGSDGADQIDLATLRGLGPDQTLVLVNGKRRHQTAFVAVFGTRGRGNSGTDLNAIPENSIDRVEILRDGASAQYGSDAIAGVINLILKKNINKWQINIGSSAYYDKKHNTSFGSLGNQYEKSSKLDGNAYNANINYGFALGKKGFMNLSGTFFTQAKTFRQVLDTNVNNKDGLPINAGRRGAGDGSVTSGGIMMNMEVPIGYDNINFYAFGGYNYKSSDAFAYSRTLNGYEPTSSERKLRFPTDANNNLIFNSSLMQSIVASTGQRDTIYNPHIQTHISDASFAFGFKGNLVNNWTWDASNSFGRNNFHFYGDKTFNASLGAAGINKNHFDDGGFSFLQNTTNVDFTKSIPHIAEGLNVSMGAEFRYEQYNIYVGEKGSYFNYDESRQKAAGSQGFPGFQPVDRVSENRTAVAGYVESDIDVTNNWLLSAAIRAENYSDFGFLTTYKFATRYKVSPKVNVRASTSTGFRAPSLQQINFSNTFTNVQGGNSFDVKIAPNYSPITRAAGIPELKQEKSINASVGFTAKPAKSFTITVDGYFVKIKDRVVLTGQFDNSNVALQPILDELNVSQAQFFANAVSTTNTGVDIILNYTKKWGTRGLNLLIAGNIQNIKVDKINVPAALNGSDAERQAFFNEREQLFVKASAPPIKLGFTADYNFNSALKLGTHLTYFGKIKLNGYGWDDQNPNVVSLDAPPNTLVPELFVYNGKIVTDLYASYKLTKAATLFFGADNLFNIHPDLGYVAGAKSKAYDGETGGAWDAVQMGYNGLRLFLKAQFNF